MSLTLALYLAQLLEYRDNEFVLFLGLTGHIWLPNEVLYIARPI